MFTRTNTDDRTAYEKAQPAYLVPTEYEEFRHSVRRLAEDKIQPLAHDIDSQGIFPDDAYEILVGAGMHAPGIAESYEGDDLDALASAILVEEVARVCASSSSIITSNRLGTTSLALFGSAEQKSRYLPEVASGEALMAYAVSEREAGSDLGAMRCRAEKTSQGWRLNGVKAWITSASVAKYLVVFAVTDSEPTSPRISAFVVHDSDEGVSYGVPEKKMGLRGSVTTEVHFDHCMIPHDRLLGELGKGMRVALSVLDHTRISIAAQAVGIAQGALDLAVHYTKDRRQFGQAIADFQGVQFMLADMAMQTEAARSLTYSAAARSDLQAADLSYFGAAAKCLASDVAMKVTTDAVQLLGGAGYTQDFPAERMMRDAKITQIYEGTNQIQRIVMSRHLLK